MAFRYFVGQGSPRGFRIDGKRLPPGVEIPAARAEGFSSLGLMLYRGELERVPVTLEVFSRDITGGAPVAVSPVVAVDTVMEGTPTPLASDLHQPSYLKRRRHG